MTSKGPVSPEEYGAGRDDDGLEEAGYASGLDVWDQVEKAYENYLGDGTLANSQLWSLKQAILAEAAGNDLRCCLCLHARTGEALSAVTVMNGQAVCYDHMGYVQGGLFTQALARLLDEIKRQDES